MTRFTIILKRLSASVLGLSLLAVLIGSSAAVAADQNLGTVAQSYNAGQDVLAGMIVGLKAKDQTTVVPLKSEDIQHMTGVVVPVGDASIVLTPPTATTQQVLVAATGKYELLVSNQNGAIKAGDYVTISALDGIGMKAGPDQSEVVGRAIQGFDGKTNILDTEQLKSSLGRPTTVSIGHIPVDIRLAPNPQYRNGNKLPDVLARAAANVAHKDVTPFRVYLSLTILLATLFITGFIFYGGIRGGIIAIGRNPLAKGAIGRGLVRAVVLGLIILVIGLLGAYVILL
jgi:hypothetical protein